MYKHLHNSTTTCRYVFVGLLFLFGACWFRPATAQNLVLNPDMELGAPIPFLPGFGFVTPLQSGDPDHLDDWDFGCPPLQSNFSNRFKVAESITRGGETLLPFNGSRFAFGEFRLFPANVDDRLQGNFVSPLTAGQYSFEAQIAGLGQGYSGQGICQVYLVGDLLGCQNARLIAQQNYLPEEKWETIAACFVINEADALQYQHIEFRHTFDDLQSTRLQLMGVDAVEVIRIGDIPDLSAFTGSICLDNLPDVDVSMLGRYDVTLMGPGGNCNFSGDGSRDPDFNLTEFCTLNCGETYTFAIDWDCGAVVSDNFTVTCPDVDLGPDLHICVGEPWPTLDAGPGFASYEWSLNGGPTRCATSANGQILTTCTPGTYCVTVTDVAGCTATDCMELAVGGQNIILNGNFSGGSAGISSMLNQSCTCNHDTYCIAREATDHCNLFPNGILDHTSPGIGRFMSINGPETGTGSLVYVQNVNVEAGVTYNFSMFLHVYGQPIPLFQPNFSISIGGQVIATVDQTTIAGFDLNDWNEITGSFTSTTTGPLSLIIAQTNSGCSAYGFDDLWLAPECCIPEVPEHLHCLETNGIPGWHWNEVPGATGYEVDIWPDVELCACTTISGLQRFQVFTPTNFLQVPAGIQCTAWRVRSICPDDTSAWSPWTCYDSRFACPSHNKMSEAEAPVAHTFELFPNPATDRLEVRFDARENESTHLQIIDLRGKTIAQFTVEPGASSLQWSIPSVLPAGVYHVILRSETRLQSQKLLLTR